MKVKTYVQENKQLLLLLGFALILRLVGIHFRQMWYDEAIAIMRSAVGPEKLIYGTLTVDISGSSADIHPPGYFLMLWGWQNLFGNELWVVRLYSVILGIGIVFLSYAIARQWFNQKTALLTAFLIAVSPFQIHYAQEIRMYAQMTFLLMGCTFAWGKATSPDQTNSPWLWWLGFSILAAAAQYSQNLAAFYLLSLAILTVFRKNWRDVARLTLAGGGALLLYLPWLLHLPDQFSKIETSYWVDRPGMKQVFTTLFSFVTNLPLPENLVGIGFFVTLWVIAIGAWRTVIASRQKIEGFKFGLGAAFLAFFPPLMMFIFSQWQPVFIERALLPSGVMFLIWLGWALLNSKLDPAGIYLTTGIFLIGAVIGYGQHLTYQGFPYGPFQSLGKELSAQLQPGDAIVHSNKLTMIPMSYFFPELAQSYVTDPPGDGSDTLGRPTQEAIGLLASPSIEAAVNGAYRVWFVIFEKAIDEFKLAGYDTHAHLEWLDSSYHLIEIATWEDILVYEYTLEE